jgi:hypothetical protein
MSFLAKVLKIQNNFDFFRLITSFLKFANHRLGRSEQTLAHGIYRWRTHVGLHEKDIIRGKGRNKRRLLLIGYLEIGFLIAANLAAKEVEYEFPHTCSDWRSECNCCFTIP